MEEPPKERAYEAGPDSEADEEDEVNFKYPEGVND